MKRQHVFTMLVAALVLVVLFTMTEPAAAQTTVFINEIHYDNAGTDAGEAIEIAGPAGTDLTGWSVVLYNGNGGASYGTTALSGTIPDMAGGFGFVVINYGVNGIQNGAPDGIALIDDNGAVIQFLSYEGAFVASGGPADGLTSTDIGVLEDGSDPAGLSLQLTGSGTTYEQFTWANPQASTFGAVNTGQDFGGEPPAPQLVINEIDYDQPGTDAAEFLEIKNVGAGATSLNGVTLELINGNGGSVYDTIALPDVSLAAGDYFVVCANAATVANCDLDDAPDTNFIQNGAPDAAALLYEGQILDAVSYEGDTAPPYTEGSGSGLEDSGATGSDNMSISRCPDGADTDQNNVDFLFVSSTPGAANACQAPVELALVINEIDYDQPSTDTAEFLEIKNVGDSAASLNGVTLELINGNGASVYDTIVLPDVSLAAGDYFVVCANAATVANCDLDDGPDTNFIQNGAPDAAALLYDGQILDAVSYEGDTAPPYTEGSGSGLEDVPLDGAAQSISRCLDGTDTDQNNIDFVFAGSTPGAENDCVVPPPPLSCTDDSTITYIHEVQGAGATSPLVGQVVVIDGVVVGDFQDNGQPDSGDLNGFYVQEEPADADSDPTTSEGILVYAPGAQDVMVGNHVRVRGTVAEFSTSGGASLMTELTFVEVAACEAPAEAPAATPVTLPVAAVGDLEAYEGMYVTFPQELNISEYFNFDRFNEVVLTVGRQFQPTAVFEPGSKDAADLASLNRRSRITLDDGRTQQNMDPALHPNGAIFNLDNRFRGGDLITNATGVIDETFGLYRIQPTQGGDYTAVNERPETPAAVGGRLKVASLNVLNYFTTLDEGQRVCGPSGFEDFCRGADNQNELDRQRAKIVAALQGLDADVIGLMEIQNSDTDEAVTDLVDGLNDATASGTYDYIPTGFLGTDVIIQAFIYKTDTVSPLGAFAALDDKSFTDPRGSGEDKNRPALAQTFIENDGGAVFTVVVNHLKSKGSGCGDGDDDPEQGSCNLTRTLAAQRMLEWLATDPTSSGDNDFLIIGDLNAYDKEDPIAALLDAGYTDLEAAYGGEFAYSYVFDGQLGYLDYGLANSTLQPQVTGATTWHINADEPDILDYDTSFKQPNQQALYEPNAFRASDHDPVIVGLELNRPPVCSGASPSVATLWPPNHKMFDVEVLGVTDPEGDEFTITITGIYQDEPVNGDDDGNTEPDAEVVGTSAAKVRAERDGEGNGRVYHIFFSAVDVFGNSCAGSVQVTVSVNSGDNGAAVDDGPLFDATIAEP